MSGADVDAAKLAPFLLARYDMDGNKVLDKVRSDIAACWTWGRRRSTHRCEPCAPTQPSVHLLACEHACLEAAPCTHGTTLDCCSCTTHTVALPYCSKRATEGGSVAVPMHCHGQLRL